MFNCWVRDSDSISPHVNCGWTTGSKGGRFVRAVGTDEGGLLGSSWVRVRSSSRGDNETRGEVGRVSWSGPVAVSMTVGKSGGVTRTIFSQFPRRRGRQLIQVFPCLIHWQFLHLPVRLYIYTSVTPLRSEVYGSLLVCKMSVYPDYICWTIAERSLLKASRGMK